jgi:hypothetical protein
MELRRVLRHLTPLFVATAAAFALGACGGNVVVDSGDGTTTTTGTGSSSGTSAGGVSSCDFTADGIHECSQYTNVSAMDTSGELLTCADESGTIGSGCTSTGELGTCAFPVAEGSYAQFYYDSGGQTADEAQMGCTEASGTWSPP